MTKLGRYVERKQNANEIRNFYVFCYVYTYFGFLRFDDRIVQISDKCIVLIIVLYKIQV